MEEAFPGPISIGNDLIVKPSWSRLKPRKGQAVVVLDPGLSFGTGQHPTTAFCLEQLVRHRRRAEAQSLLDIRHRLRHPGDRRRQAGVCPGRRL